MKALVAYFSASGVTAALARRLAEAVGAPLYEIRPAVPYTADDLDWRNRQSRSTLEMLDKNCRPALADTDAPVADAEIIFVGYPVWWYREPSIIDSFLEAYDFSGKTIVPFCSHGGGRFGQSLTAIAKPAPDAAMGEGLSVHYSGGAGLPDDVSAWLDTNGIARKGG